MTAPDDVRIVEDFDFEVARTPNEWIPLSDGTRLAARIWRPSTGEPVPAVLEYLPYRKGDGMAARDEPLGTWFAGHGFAWVRVDIRGTGDSDGIIVDEYPPQEQDDALEVIEWIGAQPWSSGAVGMVGISWGGFNGLQVAARRPPALKAVISMCSTDDRYADDVHYDGGCVLAWEALPWASVMLAWNALPPDPATVGNEWRDTWLERLDRTPPFIHEWLSHQRRDAYWQHGSVCEDYDAIECPVYMVGGWADGYTNAIGRTVVGLPASPKGLIGPWPHAWPHVATPGPRIDFLHEAARWWDRWLRDEANGVEAEPLLRAWLQEPAPPGDLHLDRPGRWVATSAWPPPSAAPRRFFLAPEALADTPAGEVELRHTGSLRHGLLAGAWCPYGPAADFPADQREEDALCLVFDTAPLAERVELLGHPRARLTVAADRPLALVALRLCDVAPDGTSTLLSRGALNLTHRDGHEHPERLVPGERYAVDVELDALGQAVGPGHRLRLALSSTYWPWLWPSPEPVELTLVTGPGSWLELPVLAPGSDDGPVPDFGNPEAAPPMQLEVQESSEPYQRIQRDLVSDTFTLSMNQGGDHRIRLPDGLEMVDESRDRYAIREGDPLSAEVESMRRISLARGAWQIEVRTRSRMTSDEAEFHLVDTVEALEDGTLLFDRTWRRSVTRDHA